MTAEIITIGDEILIGQIVDTNSAWIAEQCNLSGIEVDRITSVHDTRDQIVEALEQSRGDVVIITGGLGPTRDDVTKAALCCFFDTRLVLHQPTLDHLERMFALRKASFNKLNRDQAMVPATCEVLTNTVGTAPGMWFEKEGRVFVSVPGVPSEMKCLFETEIAPRLRACAGREVILHKTVLTQGLPESTLALTIEAWEDGLPANIKLAYLPDVMSVKLRLSARGTDEAALQHSVDAEIDKLMHLIPDNIYGFDNDTLAQVVGQLLRDKRKTLSIAESCTGGYVAHQITSVPGCSDYFKGSVVAYSNSIKRDLLGVSAESLEKYGAVSEQVAKEMATGALSVFNTDFAVSITGVAGPGGSEEKPAGTVWIAVADESGVYATLFQFGNNSREKNIVRSGQTALRLLRRALLK